MPDFIGVYPNAASDDYCERMVQRFDELESVKSSWSGSETYGAEKRRDFSFMYDMEAMDLAVETNKILDECLSLYMEQYPSLGMQAFYSKAIKVQRTPPKGGFHTWHCEHAYDHNSHFRNLTWTIYLNDIPEGEGETEFIEFGRKITPQKGMITFFPAAWTHTHRGNPVYTCQKYIATGWYYMTP